MPAESPDGERVIAATTHDSGFTCMSGLNINGVGPGPEMNSDGFEAGVCDTTIERGAANDRIRTHPKPSDSIRGNCQMFVNRAFRIPQIQSIYLSSFIHSQVKIDGCDKVLVTRRRTCNDSINLRPCRLKCDCVAGD